MLSTQHVVTLLPVSELLGEREARLRAGSVAAKTSGLADRQLGVARDGAGAGQVDVLHPLLE